MENKRRVGVPSSKSDSPSRNAVLVWCTAPGCSTVKLSVTINNLFRRKEKKKLVFRSPTSELYMSPLHSLRFLCFFSFLVRWLAQKKTGSIRLDVRTLSVWKGNVKHSVRHGLFRWIDRQYNSSSSSREWRSVHGPTVKRETQRKSTSPTRWCSKTGIEESTSQWRMTDTRQGMPRTPVHGVQARQEDRRKEESRGIGVVCSQILIKEKTKDVDKL